MANKYFIDMKASSFFLCLIYIVLFVSCDSDRNAKEETSLHRLDSSEYRSRMIIESLSINNSTVVNTLSEYIKIHTSENPTAYIVLIKPSEFDALLTIRSTKSSYKELLEVIPTGYMLVNKEVVLFYTGLERFCKANPQQVQELKQTLLNKHNNLTSKIDTSSHSTIYDPIVWQIIIKGDTILVNKSGKVDVDSRHMSDIKFAN